MNVPTGYMLVPIEPTLEMFVDGMEADCLGRPSVDDDTHVRSIWAAMIQAAPVNSDPLPDAVSWLVQSLDATRMAAGDKGGIACPDCGSRDDFPGGANCPTCGDAR